MKDSLLLTKLYIPPPNPRIVDRPRLIRRLNEGLEQGCKLTLVSASVGYGKTTLVSNWVSTLNRSVAWLALDTEDDDPLRFWTYVIAALQTIQPELGQTALTALQTAQPPLIEPILSDLINQIAVLSDEIVLVLDDYHLLESSSLHQGLNFLLEHLPPQMHLVIITREDPPLPLAQMRAKGEVIELRVNDLRFTEEESAQFLNQTMHLKLRPEEISVLEQRTEGWVAGMQMAALSMQNLTDTTGFIEAFAGDDRYVVDYLIAEVIEQQPKHIQEFLLQTAILKRLTAPLCDAVTGKDTGQVNLAYLEATNLFLIPLDNKRQWYRYHQLFGDLLQYRLKDKISSEYINQLHQGAAAWYTLNGFSDEAIYHYLVSDALDQAADLIEPVVIKLIVQGQLGKVLSWLTQLPDEFTCSRPLLSVSHAWVLTVTGQGAAADTRLKEAERCLPAASQKRAQEIQGLISIVRAYLTRNQGNIPLSIRYLRQSIGNLEADDLIVRCSVNLNLGYNYSILGQLELAEQALMAAQSDGQAVNAVYLTMLAIATRGFVWVAQGKLRRAIPLYQEAIEYGLAQNRGQPFPPAGYAYAGLGQVLYEQNDLDAAEQSLTQAVDFGELMGDWSMKRRGLLPLAWLKQMQGDSAAAQVLWQRALNVVHQAESHRTKAQLMVHRSRLMLAQTSISSTDRSALAVAAEWADSYQHSQPDMHSYQEAFAQNTLAWVELAQGKADQALSRLVVLIETADANGWNDTLIKALVLKALAYAVQGEQAVALDTLDIALAKAAPEGYFRTFVDYGPPMRQLLQLAEARGMVPDYVPKLLAAFPSVEGAKEIVEPRKTAAHQSLVEPLTDQEINILRLMAAGLSHNEIANELYLSVNTIKWHTTHIYSKLGVHRRAHAVSRARELSIL